ncbi:hypothetical protein GGX14DRAFT_537447 [Mycena pura]|uniref:5'-3' exoribonuclease 1 D1 domain-containing protein n=1 Tax=Mycena pura TaxID=153505 RepID=A0AAD6USW1_9AGAR|nr:hypothetical protein GGX14DRAFT_537447 [Mycena pura]
MEPFDLPTLDSLHLIEGLCDGVFLGAAGLSWATESRNKSMVLHIDNPHEHRKTEDMAREMIGTRTFVGWPSLQEALVVALSDSLFKYEKINVVRDSGEGVITGAIDALLHVRPLKGSSLSCYIHIS